MRTHHPRELVAQLARKMRAGDGQRFGALAKTGWGKSTILAFLVHELVRTGAADWSLAIESGRAFKGERRKNLADYIGRPARGRELVFEGNDFARERPNVEELATQAWRLVARKYRVILADDEITDATSGGKSFDEEDGALAWALGRGRKHGLSVAWSTLMPQTAPTLALVSSDVLLLGGLEGFETRPLINCGALSPEVAAVCHELQRRQVRGTFLDAKSYARNPVLYRLPL